MVEIYTGNPYHLARLVKMRLMIDLDFYIYVFSMELQSFEKTLCTSLAEFIKLGDWGTDT